MGYCNFEFSMKLKKSLGQNFLKDKKTLEKIVKAGEVSPKDNILEIGPGQGALSNFLLAKARKVIMVEKDEQLAEEIAEKYQIQKIDDEKISFEKNNDKESEEKKEKDDFQKFSFEGKSGIIFGDILKINLPKLLEENDFTDHKIIANIPYYITGKILRIIFQTKYPPQAIVFLVQKEVAERICAGKGQMNMLALSANFYGEPEIVGLVGRENFFPIPKVDSAILKITIKKKEDLPIKDEKEIKNFFSFARAGFSGRRKTLVNNLASVFGLDKKEVVAILEKNNFNPKIRAQELDLDDWIELKKFFS